VIIVSQDKEFAIIANAITDNQYILGEYTTEERAKEVLQEFVRMYQVNKWLQITGEITQDQIAGILIKAKIEPFKYEMPEK